MTPLEGFKVVTAKAMAELEEASITAGASSFDYMIRAAEGISHHVASYLQDKRPTIYLLVGKGNNGGDALAAGAFLKKKGFNVEAYLLFDEEGLSSLAQKQLLFFKEQEGRVTRVTDANQIKVSQDALILDGIFGTGFSGQVKEPIKSYIEKVNQLKAKVIAIDIPSGINGSTGEKGGVAIRAHRTCFLGMAKTGFFLRDGFDYVGKLIFVDFGLCPSYIAKASADFCLVNSEAIADYLPILARTTHKYKAGHVGIVATSPSLEGAGLLASKACYRSGAGLVRLFIPKEVDPLFFAQLPEAITIPFDASLEEVMHQRAKFNALVLGPGLAEDQPNVKKALSELWESCETPLVIDAGALFLLQDKFEGSHSKQVVLTPHRGEMARLLGKKVEDGHLHSTLQAYVEKHGVTLILKGAPTFIFAPHKTPIICPFGVPGMATGGSGDVLSGLLGALLAKGLTLREAATVGGYLHAKAGEIAADTLSSYSLLASDIIDRLPQVLAPLI